MLVLVHLLTLMMMTVKSDDSSAENITAHSGEAVLLTSGLQEAEMRVIKDIRWTHPHVVMSLGNNVTKCNHGRCELLRDGSLRFSRVQPADSGNYRLQVFDAEGKRLKVKDFLLTVDDINSDSSNRRGSHAVVVSVSMCCVILLLLSISMIFIVVRRRSQRTRTATGPEQGNIYELMHCHHSHHSNKIKEEESLYVPCHRAVSMETTMTQMSADPGDIYVNQSQ